MRGGKLLVGLWGEEVLLARQFCGRRSVWKAWDIFRGGEGVGIWICVGYKLGE
ncbi:hypothetical protein [Bartonella harrusi]|uniref:Uncharacterized protein n=1 Tax=Bartonella harrusi TaxID=2961895 RepID=A0ABY5EVX5_9HYPH|nr:hypothetical protein [Bartonella harrusi]UTO28145.1 hypothetical protein NMK50_08165 [Bartonella harrusi]